MYLCYGCVLKERFDCINEKTYSCACKKLIMKSHPK